MTVLSFIHKIEQNNIPTLSVFYIVFQGVSTNEQVALHHLFGQHDVHVALSLEAGGKLVRYVHV